jgi:multiple sugar transport system permease protein
MAAITESRATGAAAYAALSFADRLNTLGNIATWVFMILLILLTLFPFYWIIRTALTSPGAVYTNTDSLLPVEATALNFQRVLGLIDPSTLVGQDAALISAGELNFWLYLRNTLIVVGLITVGQTLFSALAAYAFARLKFPFKNQIFFAYMTGLMIPGIVLFLPNYIFVRQLGLIGTFAGIIAPTFLMTPFAVFFMRQFFLSLSSELEEAALLDGATKFGVFWRVSLPLMRGPLLTIALLTFIGSWNDYLWPFLVGRDEEVRVLTVALGIFRAQTPQAGPDWSGMMAATIVSIVPTIILFIFFGRRVVDSVQFAGFK